MKQLQNNYTTPEQSKRLLELGLPADSADCYINTNGNTINVIPEDSPKYSEYCKSLTYLIPCWSVGRLMEIFDMCYVKELAVNDGWYSYRELHKNQTYIDYILYVFTANKMQDLLDFSKLEE